MEAEKQEKTIKDYLHLYLGCDYQWQDESGEWRRALKLNSYQLNDVIRHHLVARLILRPLSDMTEDEAHILCRMQIKGMRECDQVKIVQMKPVVKFVIYSEPEDPLDERRIRRFLNIESYLVPQFKYLLDRGFDLFGLIDGGLAIQKPLTL